MVSEELVARCETSSVTVSGRLIDCNLPEDGQWLVERFFGVALHFGGLLAQRGEGHDDFVEELVVGFDEVDSGNLLVRLDI